jgi:hypothetical protein
LWQKGLPLKRRRVKNQWLKGQCLNQGCETGRRELPLLQQERLLRWLRSVFSSVSASAFRSSYSESVAAFQTPVFIIAQPSASVNPVFCSAERCCRCEIHLPWTDPNPPDKSKIVRTFTCAVLLFFMVSHMPWQEEKNRPS